MGRETHHVGPYSREINKKEYLNLSSWSECRHRINAYYVNCSRSAHSVSSWETKNVSAVLKFCGVGCLSSCTGKFKHSGCKCSPIIWKKIPQIHSLASKLKEASYTYDAWETEPTLKGHLAIVRLTDNQTLHINTQSLGIIRIKAMLSIN